MSWRSTSYTGISPSVRKFSPISKIHILIILRTELLASLTIMRHIAEHNLWSFLSSYAPHHLVPCIPYTLHWTPPILHRKNVLYIPYNPPIQYAFTHIIFHILPIAYLIATICCCLYCHLLINQWGNAFIIALNPLQTHDPASLCTDAAILACSCIPSCQGFNPSLWNVY